MRFQYVLLALTGFLCTGTNAEESNFKKVDWDALADEAERDEEIKVLSDQEKKDELERKVSALFIEKFGEKWEAARVCDYTIQNEFTDSNMWVQKSWLKEGLHYVDEDRWNDFVYNAPKGSKPWLINFGNSPMGAPDGDQLATSIFVSSICIARHLKNEFNVGFADYRKAERILESYDWSWGQYAKMAPLQIVIKDGKVYQLPQSNFGMIYYTEAVTKQLEKTAVMVAPVKPARTELNIYWEYAMRDLGKTRAIAKLDK